MNRSIQKAFSLVPALFLIVVLAILGTVAVRMSVVQSQTVVLAMQSARAYSAALSGIEWAAYQALENSNCSSSTTLALTEGGLDGFTVNVTCSSTSHTEGSSSVTVFTVESFAFAGAFGQPDYVSRRIKASLADRN